MSAIREIARESWHAAYDELLGVVAVDEQVAEWYAPGDVARAVRRDAGHYLVAERDGEVLGYVTGGTSDADHADAVLAAIYVHPDDWGEGMGSALLTSFCGRLVDDDHDDVWLAVLAGNDRARAFYEDRGFAVRECRETTVGGVDAEELVMVRELP